MKQLALVPIAPQPEQPPARIPSRTIQAYVRESMQDFGRRQREREATRKANQKKEPKRTKKADSPMHTISVTYRAIFEGPKGELNPLNLRIPGPCPVELYKSGKVWKLRSIATKDRIVYERFPQEPHRDSAMDHAARCFTRCIEPWQFWGMPAGEGEPRLLLENEFADCGNGQVGLYGPEDRTHITHPGAEYKPKEPALAACGATVNRKTVISTKANKEPTCPACAKVYRQEFGQAIDDSEENPRWERI